MRVNKEQLKQIIKEELEAVLSEATIGDTDVLKKQVERFEEYYRKKKTFRQQFRALSKLAAPSLRLRGKPDMARNLLQQAAQAIDAVTPEMIRQDRTGATGLSQLLEGLMQRAENVVKDPEASKMLQQIDSSLRAKLQAVDDEDAAAAREKGQGYVGKNQVDEIEEGFMDRFKAKTMGKLQGRNKDTQAQLGKHNYTASMKSKAIKQMSNIVSNLQGDMQKMGLENDTSAKKILDVLSQAIKALS